jgi:cytochrome c peroxidase
LKAPTKANDVATHRFCHHRLRPVRTVTAMLAFLCLFIPVSAQQTDPVNLADEPLQPLPQKLSLSPAKIALGQDLFFDTRLSKDNTLSCASCHDLALGGTDSKAFSEGMDGALGNINTPTVFNSGFSFVQFWDGRAESLNTQVGGPINNPAELGASWHGVISKLKADADYVERFNTIYQSVIDEVSIQDAIATYERSLITPNSRFDRYLNGDLNAITSAEKAGYALFKSLGCSACHQGRNIGGNMFQKFGVMGDYFADRGAITTVDYGRFNATGLEEDRYFFKVPSLRNIALTAPYFHDASATTLDAAVVVMAFYQLGRTITDTDRSLVVAFLQTLTGEYLGKPLWPR